MLENISNWIIILAMLALSSACKTNKVTTVETAEEVTTVYVADSTTHVDRQESGWLSTSWRADSVAASITADSIRTPEGSVVYRPQILVQTSAPEQQAAQVQVIREEIIREVAVSDSTASAAQKNEAVKKDTVAVAKPPSIDWLFLGCLVAAVGLIIFLVYRYIPRKS